MKKNWHVGGEHTILPSQAILVEFAQLMYDYQTSRAPIETLIPCVVHRKFLQRIQADPSLLPEIQLAQIEELSRFVLHK